MSLTWRGAPDPPSQPLRPADRLRIALRLGAIVPAVGLVLALFGLLRAVERPLHGMRRPWTARLKRLGFRATLLVIGLRLRREGTPLRGPGAQVANHTGWLDIWALNAASEVTFVSKAEVRGWPVMGWMAAISGTVFITRRRGDSATQQVALAERIRRGETLAFFPEGTSTDGRRVLAFRSTLFAALLGPGLGELRVQPVTLAYYAPPGERADVYGWWGDMTLVPHLLRVLALPRRGEVWVVLHPPIALAGRRDRKALARTCEAVVRQGLERRIGAAPAAPLTAAAR